MQALQARARTANTYLAGLGASGALMAGAAVAFIALVGVVTFNSWPEASGLFTFSGGSAELGAVTETPPPGSQAKPLRSITVIPPTTRHRSGGVAQSAASDASGISGIGRHGGGSDGSENGVKVIQGAGESVSPPAPTEDTDVLGETISNTGTAVEKSTQSLGSTINDVTGTDLGAPVTGLGQTLNDTLQSVSGS